MSNESKHVYGLHTCTAQIKANPQNIKKIFIKRPPYNKNLNNIIQIAKTLSLKIDEIDKDALTRIATSNKHQGIVFELSDIKQSSKFNIDLYIQSEKTPFIVIFDSIQDPRNLGSCIRTANAAGASLIIKKKSSSCNITPVVHKTASGGLQGLSILEANNISDIIKKLKKNNIQIIGTADSATSTIYEANIDNNGVAVILGSEDKGVSKSLLNLCDIVCKIPIYGSVSCLNVSVATGVVLYHLRRKLEKTYILK
ncbi:MAG: 23S rRNA (guanosine(2251)-2'-O)-methyltransferase RlmB [Gammaproteobacteria bacterium]|nr:23S rRNA (guanosine(2251)-2'-O)-methyltransferase RlmB [Gammaproteobacteria bacterium]|tara:strand:+ start:689 stop:1450 length:762 start_codon:yes stop_codon:yes gene_type:complete